MFTSFSNTDDALITNRLGRIQSQIASLQLSTLEDYVAQLTSLVNQVINADYQMTEPAYITAQTPGFVGDVVSTLLNINNDCGDIADEIQRLENNASVLYNLTATIQNSLRQSIREGIYAATNSSFTEAFINQNNIASSTATIDFIAGRAMATLINETVLTPTLSIGSTSIGSSNSNLSSIISGDSTNLYTWNGAQIEILITFTAPTVVNRLTLTFDDYKGYVINTLTTSPDGSLFTDVLQDLGTSSINTGATAGKYSGATIVDFSPRSVETIRLVITNPVDATTIPIRQMSVTQRTYQPSATITSNKQIGPTGQVLFQVDQTQFAPYTSITYQLSSDGLVYTTIQPGLITLPSNWWYRVIFSRSSQAFTSNNVPLSPTTADPNYSTGFTLINSTSIVISSNTIERTMVFEEVTGVIPLRETPLPSTFTVQNGNTYLTPTQYTLDDNNNLSFPSTMSAITVSYQTSAQGSTNISGLQQYYSSFLNLVTFA
jgi:hypothetical protein